MGSEMCIRDSSKMASPTSQKRLGRSNPPPPPTYVSCQVWKKRSERPNVGAVSIGSRNGAPYRKGFVVNSNKCVRPPMPVHGSHPVQHASPPDTPCVVFGHSGMGAYSPPIFETCTCTEMATVFGGGALLDTCPHRLASTPYLVAILCSGWLLFRGNVMQRINTPDLL